jgi:outer membrane protein OmpA-like peptidoglycan-associated protein
MITRNRRTMMRSRLLATAALLLALPLAARAQDAAPNLDELQRSLANVQKQVERLSKETERAAAAQQQLKAVLQENQELRSDVIHLREQVQSAEIRTGVAETERDLARADLNRMRESAEAARQALLKSLNDITGAKEAAPAEATPSPTPPVAVPKPAKKQQQSRAVITKEPLAPIPPEPKAEEEEGDQRAILGGRSSAMEFMKKPEARALLEKLHGSVDQRGLVVTIPGYRLFDSGRDKLKMNADDTIKEVAELVNMATGHNVLIIGHTDGGSAAYDQRLSERRAEAVRNCFVTEYSVRASRVSTEGRGDAEPAAPGSPSSRIEVVILN